MRKVGLDSSHAVYLTWSHLFESLLGTSRWLCTSSGTSFGALSSGFSVRSYMFNASRLYMHLKWCVVELRIFCFFTVGTSLGLSLSESKRRASQSWVTDCAGGNSLFVPVDRVVLMT